MGIVTLVFANYTDVSSENLENKLNKLSTYGIITGYEDGTFKPNNNITRAEFSKIIMTTIGCAPRSTGNYVFDDVSSGCWAEAYISLAKEFGIVNGTSDTTFEPNVNITNEQTIKMVVAALGYNEEAMTYGRYPNGYIKVASEIGLLDNMNIEPKNLSTRKIVVDIITNALDVEFYNLYKEDGKIKRIKSDYNIKQALINNKNADKFEEDEEDYIIDLHRKIDNIDKMMSNIESNARTNLTNDNFIYNNSFTSKELNEIIIVINKLFKCKSQLIFLCVLNITFHHLVILKNTMSN